MVTRSAEAVATLSTIITIITIIATSSPHHPQDYIKSANTQVKTKNMPWTKSGFPKFTNCRERNQFWRREPYRLPRGMPPDKFPDLTEDHIWGPLHDRYNTAPMVIMDKTAWHTDVIDVIRNSDTVEEVHAELEKRRKQRLDECISAIEGTRCAMVNVNFRAKSARRRRLRAAQIDELAYKISRFYCSGSLTDAAFVFLDLQEISEAESREDSLEREARWASEKKALDAGPTQETTSLTECMTNGDTPTQREGAPTTPDSHLSTMEHGTMGTNKRKRDDSEPESSRDKRPRVMTPPIDEGVNVTSLEAAPSTTEYTETSTNKRKREDLESESSRSSKRPQVMTPPTDEGTNVTAFEAPSSTPIISENVKASISGDKREGLGSKGSQNTKSQATTPHPRDDGYSETSLEASPTELHILGNDKVATLNDELKNSGSKSSHEKKHRVMTPPRDDGYSVACPEASSSALPISENGQVPALHEALENSGSKSSHNKEQRPMKPTIEAIHDVASPRASLFTPPMSENSNVASSDDELEDLGSKSSHSKEQQAMTPLMEAGHRVTSLKATPSVPPISESDKIATLDDKLEDSGSKSSHDKEQRAMAPTIEAGHTSSLISENGEASAFDDRLEDSGSKSSQSKEQQAMTLPIEAGDSVTNPETSSSAPISKNSKATTLNDKLEDSGSKGSHDRRHGAMTPPRDAGDGATSSGSPPIPDTSPSTASEDEEDAENYKRKQARLAEAIRKARQMPRDETFEEEQRAPTEIIWEIRGFRFVENEPAAALCRGWRYRMNSNKPISSGIKHKIREISPKVAHTQ